MYHLEVKNLSADYGGHKVLNDVSFTVDKGAIVSLIGPSGSGKSTILRVLAGLLPPVSGEILLNGTPVNYRDRGDVKAVRDCLTIVFQQFNLFQNMTALQNVTVAPVKIRKRNRKDVEEEAVELLKKVGLGHKLNAYPDQLSGGQQQRVAIARALALKPEILLLDEVTSALDPELVQEVLDTIRMLASEGMTMLTVSHEMGFVKEVSSKVLFLDGGCIVESGSPRQIFDHAEELRTRQFLGKVLHR
ncbi:amino acid ABC transporter ATP-binding protein [Ensifer aridi]|uniref:amino acid ABC transporter ATP-binding protein n=1 Tax=Ensifer aridi TaxID=1708715 RepID=UPI000415A6CA|nr:amino acid ABC transporter ATP-binding protein [Ensifer aridi]